MHTCGWWAERVRVCREAQTRGAMHRMCCGFSLLVFLLVIVLHRLRTCRRVRQEPSLSAYCCHQRSLILGSIDCCTLMIVILGVPPSLRRQEWTRENHTRRGRGARWAILELLPTGIKKKGSSPTRFARDTMGTEENT